MSIVEKLTEGIIRRDLSQESDALLNKWEKTGLLEGLETDYAKQSMSALLENQAKELLREASTMASGDVEGFAAVAFPIVRRVFGGLVANELVSVQPMSLPSGLIFFLDFTMANGKLSYEACESIYGGGKVASQITGGISLAGASGEDSFYNLNNGYGATTGSTGVTISVIASGTVGGPAGSWTGATVGARTAAQSALDGDRLVRFDPELSGNVAVVGVMSGSLLPQYDKEDAVAIVLGTNNTNANRIGSQIRRLTRPDFRNNLVATPSIDNLLFVLSAESGSIPNTVNALSATLAGVTTDLTASFVIADNFVPGTGLGSVAGAPVWDLEALGTADGGGTACRTVNSGSAIAELDIKVDSVAITAMTKKLRAKWTPELQQDINAYHNLDAEVELTSILSEAIALEIDQEILEDLIKGATADTFHWSRRPGNFVNRDTGAPIIGGGGVVAGQFTGTVSEWYETLLETVNDVSAQIHRKTLRGGANFLVCGPETANVLEFTNGFRADTTADENRGTAGTVKTGTISKKWDVYVDPYFPRNVILVGRKGSGFLESGYVYAPYVPLQTTPTIFDPENFTPRKGVMTRYGKKMVRPDMYGLVIIENLFG